MLVQARIELDRGYSRAVPEEFLSEDAETGTDFEHLVARTDTRTLDHPLNNAALVEKVLP